MDVPSRFRASDMAMRTHNPIRRVVEGIRRPADTPTKPLINLSLGDPSAFGHLECPDVLIDSVVQHVRARTANGYLPASGSQAAKRAIAESLNSYGCPITENDVVIGSGCSGALHLAITSVMNPGDNILVPLPGFPLYEVIANSIAAEAKHYRLHPDQNWECDIAHMESLITPFTKAIIVTNPSNPCGSVFSHCHLLNILALARRHSILIIADEIYGAMTFLGVEFVALGSICGDFPILSVGGLAKQFIVPGWRVGWVVIHDSAGHLTEIRQGLQNLSQVTLGANTLIQATIPDVLTPPAGSQAQIDLAKFHDRYMTSLQDVATFARERISMIPGLRMIMPQGAMYAMIEINMSEFEGFVDDMAFVQSLLDEELVFVLPGQCFHMPNFVRIVTCPSMKQMSEAMDRLQAFCSRYHRK